MGGDLAPLARLALGAAAVDVALGGGLQCGALHEATGEPGALSAFALALAARAARMRRRPVLMVQQELAQWEAGGLYGPGLTALGLPSQAVLLVRVRRPQDVLFVMEEGLRCAGLSVVLGEFLSPVPEVLTATRRLSLAAREGEGLGLLLRHKADPSPCAALTRWRITAQPSPAPDGWGGLGGPCLLARLVRNRFGPTGDWSLAWREGAFHLAEERAHDAFLEPLHEPVSGAPDRVGAALSQPVPAALSHRSVRAEDVA